MASIKNSKNDPFFKFDFNQLKKGSHIYLMGICGTAMASLASLLKDRGFKVTGSDRNVYPPMSTFLKDKGISISEGYRPENLDRNPDFVVVGNVISRHFPEAQALLERKIPFGSLPQTMGDLIIENRHSVVVCGTHGKTTTTSLSTWAAECAGLNPGFLIGGIAKNFGTSARNPEKNWFVIEGDEYDSAFFAKVPKFTFYKPQSAILTSIEFDHADIYPNMEAIFDAFDPLAQLIPKDGHLIYNGNDENVKKIAKQSRCTLVSYGMNDCDWSLEKVAPVQGGLEFSVSYKGKTESQHFLPMFGEYNALNALGVYALFRELSINVPWENAFGKFQGIKRRQELLGTPGGVQVIEDFAHHPTAVHGTLQSFKRRLEKQNKGGRLFAFFEPRSATSRRNYFQKEYTEALALADHVYVAKPFDHEKLGDQAMDVDEMAKDLSAVNVKATAFVDVEEVFDSLAGEARTGDVVVIMSNGGFQGIYQKIFPVLETSS